MDEDAAMEILQQKKALKTEMQGLTGMAQEEASQENMDRDHETANEENAEKDAAKQREVEESQKRAAELANLKAMSEEKDKAALEKLRADAGLASQVGEETISRDHEEANKENAERDFVSVEDKIKADMDKDTELGDQRQELNREYKKAEGAGDKKKLDEIAGKIKENKHQRMVVERGEKLTENYEKDLELYNQITELEETKKSLQGEEAKILADKIEVLSAAREDLAREAKKQHGLENWKENGLDGAKGKREKMTRDFKEAHGYQDGLDKTGRPYGEGNRLMINEYFGVDLPVFSKDLKWKESQGWEMTDNNDSEAKRSLAEKQAKFYEHFLQVQKRVDSLDDATMKRILKEHQLEISALNELNTQDSGQGPVNDAIDSSFNPHVSNLRRNIDDLRPEDKNYPELSDGKTPEKMRGFMSGNSHLIVNYLLIDKIARERGLYGAQDGQK
jgi:hypothetical protein